MGRELFSRKPQDEEKLKMNEQDRKSLEQFLAQKPSYLWAKQHIGLEWLNDNYNDLDGRFLRPVDNYDAITKQLPCFGFLKYVTMALVIFGVCAVVKVVWWVLGSNIGNLVKESDDFWFIVLLAGIFLGIGPLILTCLLIKKFSETWKEFMDSWITVNWVAPSFHKHLLEVCVAGIPSSPEWMMASIFDLTQNPGGVPKDVMQKCDERLVRLALEVVRSESEGASYFSVDSDKEELKRFLQVCKRFEIVPLDADPRPYYVRAKNLLRREKSLALAAK